jgi:hypothetical protein
MRFCVRSLLLLLACCTSAFGQTQSTSYPLKPVRLILGPGPAVWPMVSRAFSPLR